jgi:SAM-dependent methyltransferase
VENLPLGLTEEALVAAAAEADPESLAASVRLRQQFGPELAAAAVTQVVLRRRAAAKFGAAAAELFFTRDGLEQASRPEVADHHAARMVKAGARRVVDLGCGVGTDAMAFARAGLDVVAVDRDAQVADVARANLDAAGFPATRVLVGAAEELWATMADRGTGVFCDPARRNSRSRSWRVEDLSPDWSFVTGLLAGPQPTGIKLGPGLPHTLIPAGVEAEWLSSRGDTVEVGLWSGSLAESGRWSALVLSEHPQRLVTVVSGSPPVDRPRRYLYEPLGAVIRCRGVATLADQLDAALLHPDLAYLTADAASDTPFASRFAIMASFPFRGDSLRRWTTDNGIGVLEIKTRGLDLDPAVLRRRLRLRGRGSATVVITRTPDGPTVLVVRR